MRAKIAKKYFEHIDMIFGLLIFWHKSKDQPGHLPG